MGTKPRVFDGAVKEINGGLLIHSDEQLKKWKENFTTVLNRITFDEIPLLVDEMASCRKSLQSSFSKEIYEEIKGDGIDLKWKKYQQPKDFPK